MTPSRSLAAAAMSSSPSPPIHWSSSITAYFGVDWSQHVGASGDLVSRSGQESVAPGLESEATGKGPVASGFENGARGKKSGRTGAESGRAGIGPVAPLFLPEATGRENGAPGAGPGASGGKSEAPGPRPVRTHSFPGATDKFDAPTLSAGVGPLGNGRRTVPESARRLEKRAATVGTLPVSGRKRRRLRCGE
jgi:hypothetical protein